jgi:Na+/H+ antiporter NhaD/arsenite permease-like protein
MSVLPLLTAGQSTEIIPPNPLWILPFLVLLGAIALMPLFAEKWWQRYYYVIPFPLAAAVIGYYYWGLDNLPRMLHSGIEYLSFICLIGSLFVVAGGIHITFKGEANPRQNTILLGIGAVIANIFGTTGAAMLLIRPYIRMNKWRFTPYHIVFFIFIVANCGGALTPIGDPPLFLGYLKGVPFFWVFQHLWLKWLVGIVALLTLFYFVDRHNYLKASPAARAEAERDDVTRIEGLKNLFFLAIILGAVFIQKPPFLREGIMVAAAWGSYMSTSKILHGKNAFTFHPIIEVAVLFIGIFATMVPALDWLEVNASKIGLTDPGSFYWGCGILSGVLDNAPTYLNFLTAAFGTFHLSVDNPAHMQIFLSQHGRFLEAISLAAVFFGAATYIGNGPNFMVKSIAEHAGVKVPSFLGYVFKFTLPFLLPILVFLWLIFFFIL